MSQLIITQREFQELAEKRLVEAKALLDQVMWDGAYYLAGYAVELALKSCIIKLLMATDAFPDNKVEYYVHAATVLVKLAKLDGSLAAAADADPIFKDNWILVKDWSEQKRYHRVDKSEAEELYNAISEGGHGVLSWIKTQW